MESILNREKATQLKDEGLKKAVDSTTAKNKLFIKRAFFFCKKWIAAKPVGYSFLMEEFRDVYAHKLSVPSSNRVYGRISELSKKNNLITSIGPDKTKSKKSHCAYATKWEKL